MGDNWKHTIVLVKASDEKIKLSEIEKNQT